MNLNNIKKIYAYIILSVVLNTSVTIAQDRNISLPQVLPMTPTAASFAQYADYPVSHYTGIPSVSIPLYEVIIDDFNFPISLNYHSSGIKGDQEASWVGLGWTLNASSLISRTVKYADDFIEHREDRYHPYCKTGYYYGPQMNSANTDDFYERSGNNHCDPNAWICFEWHLISDPEPDIFYYNLPHMSGKFIFDKSKNAILFDKSHNIKIEIIKNQVGNVSFKIIDKEGNQYYYEDREITRHYTTNKPLYKNIHESNTKYDDKGTSSFTEWVPIHFPDGTPDMVVGPVDPYRLTTSWYLSKIVTKNKKEIKFTYEDEHQELPTQESTEMYQIPINSEYNDYETDQLFYKSKTINEAKRLTSIQWDSGEIKLKSSRRDDMYSSSYNDAIPEKMDVMEIYNNQNLLKCFQFEYSHFNNNYSGDVSYEHIFKRLKLEKVIELSSNKTPLNKGYIFNYFDGSLPAKNSKDLDYWGYQNGKKYGKDYYSGVFVSNGIGFDGAVKKPNLQYTQIGTLQEIIYPTRGSVKFTYELNEMAGNYFYYNVPQENTKDTENFTVFKAYNDDYSPCWNCPETMIKEINLPVAAKVTIESFYENHAYNIECIYDKEYNYNDEYSHPIGVFYKVDPISEKKTRLYRYGMPPLYENHPNGSKGVGCEYTGTKIFNSDLEAGVYQFEANTPPKGVTVQWVITIKYKSPLPLRRSDNENQYQSKVGGLRIAEIKSDATTRKFNYSLGKMLVDPMFYYIGQRVGRSHECYIQVSEPKMPFSTFNKGNFVGYDWVEEYIISGADTSMTRYNFHNEKEEAFYEIHELPNSPVIINYMNGLIKSEKLFTNSKLLKSIEYTYHTTLSNKIEGFIDKRNNGSELKWYNYQIEWPLKRNELINVSNANGNIISRNEFLYNTKDLLEDFTLRGQDNEIIKKEKYKYPFDFSDTVSRKMVENNMIGTPSEVLHFRNNNIIWGSKTNYKDTLGIILPDLISTLKNIDPLEEENHQDFYTPEIYFDRYNSSGKIIQVRDNEVSYVYLWSYKNQHPIVKIENITYDEITDIISESVINTISDKSQPSDSDWLLLNRLRDELPKSLVTIYTYKPLVGIQSITDPRGIKTTYEYDDFGRLEFIKDHEGKIIEEYKYNYRNK